MTVRWGVYCSREHRVLKRECEFCNGDCGEELLEPPFESEYVEGEFEEYEFTTPSPNPIVYTQSEIDDIPF